jgi:hypothetical protein
MDVPSGVFHGCLFLLVPSVDAILLPLEPPSIIEGHRPPAYWPSNSGGISVENLVLKYSPELEPVLQGVSFHIKVRFDNIQSVP